MKRNYSTPFSPLIYLTSFILVMIFFFGCACQKGEEILPPEMDEASGQTMGTTWSVKVFTDQEGFGSMELTAIVRKPLDAVDAAMSTYKSNSELSLFNASRSTDWFHVSKETAEVVALALDVSRQTGGAFDITVGPLVNLWRFGPDKEKMVHLPTEEQLQAARSKVGYQHLQVRMEPSPALQKKIPDLYVDLSAIAKGFAVDQVAKELVKYGITSFMVEVGGETRCMGRKPVKGKPEGNPWIMGIESPAESRTSPIILHRTVRMDELAMATSGDYRNYLLVDGVRFSHLIDPRTGKPREMFKEDQAAPDERLGSVSIIASDCTTADAWATALFVLGPEEGIRLANQLGLSALFIIHQGAGFRELVSDSFRKNVHSSHYPGN